VSGDPAGQSSESVADPGASTGQPSEDELRAAYEAELSRITAADMMLQTAVSLLNIGGRRLGLTGRPDRPEAGEAPAGGDAPAAGERDLEQVRDAIDGVRALLGILERSMPQELRPLRDALSQLQIAYARETRAGGNADQTGGQAGPARSGNEPPAEQRPDAPGPAQASGRLWVPGS
jgi:hypothetical protein